MKNILTSVVLLYISFQSFSLIRSGSIVTKENINQNFTITGKLYYTFISRGGIQRDEKNLTLIPLQKFTMYIIRFSPGDSVPIVVKSFKTNKNGEFSVSLPSGKYGFVTSTDVKTGLMKGQCLPKSTETEMNNIVNSSVWECSISCPLELDTNSIKNLEIINHRISSCMNCQ